MTELLYSLSAIALGFIGTMAFLLIRRAVRNSFATGGYVAPDGEYKVGLTAHRQELFDEKSLAQLKAFVDSHRVGERTGVIYNETNLPETLNPSVRFEISDLSLERTTKISRVPGARFPKAFNLNNSERDWLLSFAGVKPYPLVSQDGVQLGTAISAIIYDCEDGGYEIAEYTARPKGLKADGAPVSPAAQKGGAQ